MATEYRLGYRTAENFAVIFMVISDLLLLLKTLKVLGIEKLMNMLLRPFLRLLGISKDSTNLTIIGITLGLSFGGGLLINEAKKGHISARDEFTAIMLLNLLHSLIEDTLLIGADFYTIFWGRIVFSILIVALISNAIKRMNPTICERYFYRDISQS